MAMDTPELFEGVRILDFTGNLAGPHATLPFAELGAEVVKVERPGFGDDVRHLPGPIGTTNWCFIVCNHGKKSIEVDLADPEGVELIKRMIPDFDVIIESNRPGVMAKLGLDYEACKEVKEDIIYCSISAYGQTGPLAKKPGYDLILQGRAGLIDGNGDPSQPPQRMGIYAGDEISALNARIAIASALYYHEKTGQGQYLDISIFESLAVLNQGLEQYTLFGQKATRTGNHDMFLAPYGVYNGKDGQAITLCAPSQKLWEQMLNAMGRPEHNDDPDLNTTTARIKNKPKMIAVIEDWLCEFDDIGEAVKILDDAGIPVGKVQMAWELAHDPQYLERGGIIDLATSPQCQAVGAPARLKYRNPEVAKYSLTPRNDLHNDVWAPGLGEHNHEILDAYLGADGVDRLIAKWTAK
ncbi:CaiB/BaiF CoA transferase family protein [Gordonibacter pamelaeae]|uniref:CaiB/BaiF CoA transferase family protein n=1 Tax=Gordonibacter pamelaeae TaxID=471189 RepID=UPI00242AD42F|nr:CoA transferase [Gordonibacter pamelaeae]